MNTELANTNEQNISVLNGLAMQAQALRMSINVNMWQLARVFIEAKELVPHGEWGQWLQDNADVSERTAQDMMAAYKRFGGKPQFNGLGQAKTFKMLPLPAGTEEKFMEEHDVSSMTTREVQEAVRKVREEANAEIKRERDARIAAERRAEDAENRPPEIQVPAELDDELRRNREQIGQLQAETERLSAIGNDAIAEQRRLLRENSDLKRENREQADLMAEQQEDIDRAQRELLDMQSAIAKGDAERVPADQLTPDAFASAVRAFIGTCARMPHMRHVFSTMNHDEKEEYRLLLTTVEKWAEESRKALESTMIDGMVIVND